MDILIVNQNWPSVLVFDAPASDILLKTCQAFSENIYYNTPSDSTEELLVIFEPIVCLSVQTIEDFIKAEEPSAMKIGESVVATYFPKGTVADRKGAPLSSGMFQNYYLPAEESFIAGDAYNTYLCEEILRGRVNTALLEKGVFISDVSTAYISPLAEIEVGAMILPNCQIYGKTYIGANAKIGPNTMIKDSIIGEHSKINASQVFESTVGCEVSVGPFAYIRPNSKIENKVKIGDFVEIKKSRIGEGTKISHFAYIGDSDIGKDVNFSCGAITVNYDGKNKYKTVVEDNSFIGCNVNLVAPVTVGNGAFVAAGSTITENVPANALSVGRGKQYNKEDWASKRRQDGKL